MKREDEERVRREDETNVNLLTLHSNKAVATYSPFTKSSPLQSPSHSGLIEKKKKMSKTDESHNTTYLIPDPFGY
jgi:hypothetical protein